MRVTARNSMKIGLAGVCVVAVVLAVRGGDGNAPASGPARIAYGPATEIGKLAGLAVVESSGLACGRVNPGVFWTHNDSGDGPVLYAFSRKGEHLATVGIAGAAATDWEDLCSFKDGEKGVLLIGDFGDNLEARTRRTLYLIHEPKLPAGRRPAKLNVTLVEKVHFDFADGPHNCESIGWDPTTRTAIIITKERRADVGVYLLPWPEKPADAPVTLKCVATLAIPRAVTGMDVSPDGRRAVVMTYLDAYEYVRGEKESWADAFKRKPRKLDLPRRPKGEGICYGPAGRSLYLTTEGRRSPIWELPAKGPTSQPGGK